MAHRDAAAGHARAVIRIKEWILRDDPKEGRTLMRGLGAGVITYLVTGSLGLAVLAVVVSSCLG